MRISLIVLFLMAVVIVVLAFQDTASTSISLPIVSTPISGSLPVVLIGTLLLGFAFGVLAMLPSRIGAGLRARKARKKLEEMGVAAPTAMPKAETTPTEASPSPNSSEADEMQRLADEVAKRTAETQQGGPPPLTP